VLPVTSAFHGMAGEQAAPACGRDKRNKRVDNNMNTVASRCRRAGIRRILQEGNGSCSRSAHWAGCCALLPSSSSWLGAGRALLARCAKPGALAGRTSLSFIILSTPAWRHAHHHSAYNGRACAT